MQAVRLWLAAMLGPAGHEPEPSAPGHEPPAAEAPAGIADERPGRGRRADQRQGAPPGLEQLIAERGGQLMRIAVALTQNRQEAEDLLQTALERLLRNRRVDVGDLESYLRRTLYNLAADGWRRRGSWRGKLALLRVQHRAVADDTAAGAEAVVDARDALLRWLRQLPPRQRAVIVLRYWEQRTEAETAELLGCSEGTVKSAASRALQRLRELAGRAGPPERAGPPGLTSRGGQRQEPRHDGPPGHVAPTGYLGPAG